jgi:hypothetical protein
MKCPECRNSHRAKLGQTCSQCGYHFAFNPKSSDTPKMTDGKFLSYVRTASRFGTQYFTGNQLYAAYCRAQRFSRWPLLIVGVALLGVGLAFLLSAPNCFAFGLLGLGALFLFSGIFGKPKIVSPQDFQRYIETFQKEGKPIEMLIDKPALHEPPPDWPEPDIYDYGVERLLIVERNILVDLFVKNEQHTEQRMLVISENGYPSYLLPVAKKLLDERPGLPVFLLHDATFEGISMKSRIENSDFLPISGHPVTDLGLFPEDFQKLQRTKHIDPANQDRALPVDALMMPFLIGGMGAAFVGGMALSDLVAMEHRTASGNGGGDFDFG